MKVRKRVIYHGARGTEPRSALGNPDRESRKAPSATDVLAHEQGRADFYAASESNADSGDRSGRVMLPAKSPQAFGLYMTHAGLDITERVAELVWLALERSYLTFEMVHDAFSGDDLSSDDMAAVCRTLAEAGVDPVAASKIEPVQAAAGRGTGQMVPIKYRNDLAANDPRQMGGAKLAAHEVKLGPLGRIVEADQEMRHILYSFGFAAREHIVRAEKLLAHESEQSFAHLVAASKMGNRIQYLQSLPLLITRVRTLDQKASAAYKKWRLALGRPEGELHRASFRKLNRKLQRSFPAFCYRSKVIQEMVSIAQSIAAKFRSSQQVLEQARRYRDPVCQMPLIDVERQTIETMEEFVRMPCEVFLANCARLKTAVTSFQQARRELIQDHLHMVGALARRYSDQGAKLPVLIREGIFGLIQAAESIDNLHGSGFSAYAASRIRQGLRNALGKRPHGGPSPPHPSNDEARISPDESVGGTQQVSTEAAGIAHGGD
jgi:RNA polymerase primary sigma factor